MKKLFLFLLMSISFVHVSAQTSYTCLGIWQYLDVYYENGRYVAQMQVPPEGLLGSPNGPGMPYYENYYGGSTVNVVFHRYLPVDLSTYANPDDMVIEVPVRKWVQGWGSYNTSGNGVQCYYFVVLRPQFPID